MNVEYAIAKGYGMQREEGGGGMWGWMGMGGEEEVGVVLVAVCPGCIALLLIRQ